MEGRGGVEPLTGPAPETASGTTRPPRTRAALNSGSCRSISLSDRGGDLQRWHHLVFSLGNLDLFDVVRCNPVIDKSVHQDQRRHECVLEAVAQHVMAARVFENA